MWGLRNQGYKCIGEYKQSCSTSSGLEKLLKPLKLATFSLSPAYVIQSVSIFLLFACQYWITGQGNALSTNETKLSQIRTFGACL